MCGDPMRWTEQQLADHEAKRAALSLSAPPFAVPADDGPLPVTISVSGDPQGKGRARSFVRGGTIGHYTPKATRAYEDSIREVAMREMGNQPPLDQPVEFIMRAIFAVPASWSQRKRDAALVGDIKPGKKPDLDNIAKAFWDALNGVVYRDDSLIVKATFEKRYGPQALVVATVRAV